MEQSSLRTWVRNCRQGVIVMTVIQKTNDMVQTALDRLRDKVCYCRPAGFNHIHYLSPPPFF